MPEDEEVSPLTEQTGPLPQAGSWALGEPHTLDESMRAIGVPPDSRVVVRRVPPEVLPIEDK